MSASASSTVTVYRVPASEAGDRRTDALPASAMTSNSIGGSTRIRSREKVAASIGLVKTRLHDPFGWLAPVGYFSCSRSGG